MKKTMIALAMLVSMISSTQAADLTLSPVYSAIATVVDAVNTVVAAANTAITGPTVATVGTSATTSEGLQKDFAALAEEDAKDFLAGAPATEALQNAFVSLRETGHVDGFTDSQLALGIATYRSEAQ